MAAENRVDNSSTSDGAILGLRMLRPDQRANRGFPQRRAFLKNMPPKKVPLTFS